MTLKNLKRNQKGFTLIELMIVIAIIGILAAIAIPNFIAYRDKSYCSGAESDANSILSTLADYYAVPGHTGNVTGNIGPGATNLLGVDFKALSNGNTAALTGTTGTYRVAVLDTSTRCPTGYRTAQSGAGWTTTATGGSFRKTM